MPWINTRYYDIFIHRNRLVWRVLSATAEGVRHSKPPPSRPAPPHWTPPRLGWGRNRACSPAGLLAAYLPIIPLQGLIDFQLAAGLYFPPFVVQLQGERGCLSWGQMKLIIKILCLCSNFHDGQNAMDLIFCKFHLQHIYTCRIERSYLWPPLFVPREETEAWRGLPHCDHMLGYLVTYTLKR